MPTGVTEPVLQSLSSINETTAYMLCADAPLFFNHICVIHQSLVTMAQANEQGGE